MGRALAPSPACSAAPRLPPRRSTARPGTPPTAPASRRGPPPLPRKCKTLASVERLLGGAWTNAWGLYIYIALCGHHSAPGLGEKLDLYFVEFDSFVIVRGYCEILLLNSLCPQK